MIYHEYDPIILDDVRWLHERTHRRYIMLHIPRELNNKWATRMAKYIVFLWVPYQFKRFRANTNIQCALQYISYLINPNFDGISFASFHLSECYLLSGNHGNIGLHLAWKCQCHKIKSLPHGALESWPWIPPETPSFDLKSPKSTRLCGPAAGRRSLDECAGPRGSSRSAARPRRPRIRRQRPRSAHRSCSPTCFRRTYLGGRARTP